MTETLRKLLLSLYSVFKIILYINLRFKGLERFKDKCSQQTRNFYNEKFKNFKLIYMVLTFIKMGAEIQTTQSASYNEWIRHLTLFCKPLWYFGLSITSILRARSFFPLIIKLSLQFSKLNIPLILKVKIFLEVSFIDKNIFLMLSD